MRVAVLSDIHGNLPALEAVLAALRPYDAIWQLGDIVGYGPQPNEVISRLREEQAGGVVGNHDLAALGRIETGWFNEQARIAVEWASDQLEPESRAWLAGLPERTSEGEMTMVHGSPRDPVWEYVLTAPVARASLAVLETRHALVGHTHVPFVFREEEGRIEALSPSDGSRLVLDPRRSIVNPGSVGQPRDGDPRACGMVLDTESGEVRWYRVPYPIEVTQRRMRRVGLPQPLVDRLSHGL